MSLGLIARADTGGVGVQTWELAQHLWPDRILIPQVKADPPRGPFAPERYEDLGREMRICGHVPKVDDLAWLCETGDVLTVEGCYNDVLIDIAARTKTRLSIHANPELFGRTHGSVLASSLHVAANAGYIRPLAPTDWEIDRIPRAELCWMPVDRDRIRHHTRIRPPETFLHVSAPAMLDRNGTDLLMAALPHYHGPNISVLVAGPARPLVPEKIGPVTVVPVDDVEHYWERYGPEVDALILPRRYGGLSLVMQEALAAGLPVIALDRHPENTWRGVTTVPVKYVEHHRMKGGDFAVASCDPEDLADAIREHVLANPLPRSFAAHCHAETISWSALRPRWKEAFA